jgi:predicted DNA-binding ribbon-helix-helix protein
VSGSRKEIMSMRLEPSLHDKLKRVADRKGLATSALIRMWLIERLEQDAEDERRKKSAR